MIGRYPIQRLSVSAALIAVMLLVDRLLDPLSSPLGFRYVVDHLSWSHFFGDLNTLPALLSVIASDNPRNPNETIGWLAFLLQWGLVGFAVGAVFFRQREQTPAPDRQEQA